MRMRFSHSHAIFMRRTRGDYESVLSQEDDPESGEDGVHPERRKKTELAMADRLTKETTKTQSKRLNDEA
jgi:hypothetical protein